MLNLSSGNTTDVAKGVSEYYNSKSTFWRDSNGSLFTIKFNAQFSVASSMGDVSEDSHLLVIVDDVLGEADPELGGGPAGGLAGFGRIGYIEYSSSTEGMIRTGRHELGHMLGLGHVKNGTNNLMSYDPNNTVLTKTQMQDIWITSRSANTGYPNWQSSTVTTNNWFYNTSTNDQPWYFNTTFGEKIPYILNNNPPRP